MRSCLVCNHTHRDLCATTSGVFMSTAKPSTRAIETKRATARGANSESASVVVSEPSATRRAMCQT
jgi:hypothetical protein